MRWVALLGVLTVAVADAPIPATPKKAVVDEYHGVKVTDDYRWLENGDDAAVRAWSDAQNAHARAVLDALPAAPALRKRLTELLGAASVDWTNLTHRKGVLFAMKTQPPKPHPFLVTMDATNVGDNERVIVDPSVIDATGGTAIDFYVPSLDGKRVAVSMSKGGSEDGTVRVFDVASGKETDDVIPRVNGGTAGGSVAWNLDGSGFWYTRYPRGTERAPEDMNFYQQVYFHALGTPTEKDVYAIGKEFPRIAEVALSTSDDGKWLLASVANGDGGEYAQWLRGPDGKWIALTSFSDRVIAAKFGRDDAVYLLSRLEVPKGKIRRVPLATPRLAGAVTIVPESDASIDSFVPATDRIFIIDVVGGPSRVRQFDLDGKQMPDVPIPPISAVSEALVVGANDLLFRNESYVAPPAWLRAVASGGAKPTKLCATSSASFADVDVNVRTATSKDGTKVPMTVLKKRTNLLDVKYRTLLQGYGGFSVNIAPNFDVARRVWLDADGVIAIANLRGGSEFGEEWHQAGCLTKKQNVFDDFAACAKLLLDDGFTSKGKLAIEGGSNGGLLMGAELTQHPDMWKAVVSHVGIYDMLRVELTPNGSFNVTEYGTVRDPDLFRAMFAYSPYHHVVDGTAYPATLFMTGANDPRVEPWHSRKMVARLQAATSSKAPILLRTSANSGHGIGSSLGEQIEEAVDVDAFLFDQLGMTVKASGQ
ncbi:MAG: S9 family peptidase [Planctomycetes bacterium]|nr:S9 family peptidase [Planctomycetota bacterium]